MIVYPKITICKQVKRIRIVIFKMILVLVNFWKMKLLIEIIWLKISISLRIKAIPLVSSITPKILLLIAMNLLRWNT